MTKTYSAFYQDDHSQIIYRHRKAGDGLEDFPEPAVPAFDRRSTYHRIDGGDRFAFALFATDRGKLIVVQRDDYVPRQRKDEK